MATEPPSTSPAVVDHSLSGPYSPPHVGNGPYPQNGFPLFDPYLNPVEGNNSGVVTNADAGPQFVPFPPPSQDMGYTFSHPPPGQVLQGLRPKRKQVKMACTNCATACKRCDDHRPCERCTKYGLMDSCVDGQRKERKKGLKRGPYKRKATSNPNESSGTSPQQPDEGELQQYQHQAHDSAVHTSAAIHAFAQFATPGGYYPPPGYVLPPGYMPPTGYMQLVNDGQFSPAGPPNVNGQPQLMVPYYIHPGSYPPFSYYPPLAPGTYTHHCVPLPPPEFSDPLGGAKRVDPQGAAGGSGTEPRADPPSVPVGEKKAKAPEPEKDTQANDAGEGLAQS